MSKTQGGRSHKRYWIPQGYSALFSARMRNSRSLIGHQASAIAQGQPMTGIRRPPTSRQGWEGHFPKLG